MQVVLLFLADDKIVNISLRLCRESGYPDTRPKLPLPDSIFRFQLPVKTTLKIHLNAEATQMEVGNGEATIVFDIWEIITGKSTFIVTLIKQEKLVFILVIL